MSSQAKLPNGPSKAAIVYMITLVSVVGAFISYAYAQWNLVQREGSLTPKSDIVYKMAKDLKRHHSIYASFPSDLHEMNARVWKKNFTFFDNGRSFEIGHYYLQYHRVGPNECRIWAFPVGERADNGLTFHVRLEGETQQVFRAPPFSLEEIRTARNMPSPTRIELARLGFNEESAPPKKSASR